MASNSRSVPIASALAVYSGVSNETWTWDLRGQIVDFVGLRFLDDADQIGRIGDVAVVQMEANACLRADRDRDGRPAPC